MTWSSNSFLLPVDYCGFTYCSGCGALPAGTSCVLTFKCAGSGAFNYTMTAVASAGTHFLANAIGPDTVACSPWHVVIRQCNGPTPCLSHSPTCFDYFDLTP